MYSSPLHFLDLWAACVTCVCDLRVRVPSRRWGHELKRRLMSQDMKAQAPICSLPYSGGCPSPHKTPFCHPTHTHTHTHTGKLYVYTNTTASHQERQGLAMVCLSGRGRVKEKEGSVKQSGEKYPWLVVNLVNCTVKHLTVTSTPAICREEGKQRRNSKRRNKRWYKRKMRTRTKGGTLQDKTADEKNWKEAIWRHQCYEVFFSRLLF